MLQCCYHRQKLVVIVIGCAICKNLRPTTVLTDKVTFFSDTDCPGEMF